MFKVYSVTAVVVQTHIEGQFLPCKSVKGPLTERFVFETIDEDLRDRVVALIQKEIPDACFDVCNEENK